MASARLLIKSGGGLFEATPDLGEGGAGLGAVLFLTLDSKRTTEQRLRTAGATEVAHDSPDLNPFWPRTGATAFLDPDGYMLILAND